MALQPIGLDAVLNNVPDFTAGINKMNQGVDSFAQNSTKQAGMFAGGFGEIVTGALRKIGELGVQALLKAGQAVAGFVKDSIGLAGTFEANMLQFQSVAGKAVDTKGLEEFRDLFIDIGKRLPVSTSEVQQAAIEMVKGGIDPATIAAGGLEQNIQFAAAAMGGDLVKAAEISSKIMGGWAGVGATAAEKADFLTHATDLLARAANASATDVEGLSRGIFNAQGIARTAGVSFDDLTTTLAALAPRFASSSEAGNSLKNMIVRLQPTTDPAIEAMSKLGLYTAQTGSAFYDAAGNFVGFETAGQLLKESLIGLTKETQAATLQQIFGNDAMGSAAALAELGAAGYQEMADALSNANGVMAAAALKQQGFDTALSNAKGSVEALQITIGSALLPVLTELMNTVIAPGVNILTDFASEGAVTEKTFAGLSPTMQQFALFATDAFNAIKTGIGIAIAIGTEVDKLISRFNQAGGASESLGAAVSKLSALWDTALAVITNVANGYLAIINAVLPIVAGFVDEHGNEISSFFKSTWDSIIQIVTLALEVYDAIVPPILNAIAGFIEEHSSEIQRILSGAWTLISSLITGTLDTIKGVFTTTLALINGDWEGAWNGIKGIVDTQVKAIEGIVTGFLNIIAGIFDTDMDALSKTWQDNWDQLYDIATQTDWLQVGTDIINGIIDGVNDAASRLMSTLTSLADDALQAAKDALGISSPSTEFAAIGGFAIDGIIKGFADGWPRLRDQVATISEDLIGEMSDIGSQIQDAIASGFGATASIDRQIAKNLDKFKDVLPQYEKYTTGALKEAQLQAQEFLDPAEGAKFFKMRSDQILEYAKLQKDLAETTNAEDRERIQQQMLLINRAQTAEINQFDATRNAANPMTDIAKQIDDIMRVIAGINLTEEQIQIVSMLTGAFDRLSQPPAASPRTPYNPGVTTTNTTNLNMPIYTNNSPAAMQQSMAIASAALL